MVRRIFALSLLILFLEMLLVRWIGTEIRVFAYLQNGVLVAAFLGLGLGLRNARTRVQLLPSAVSLVFIAAVIRDPFHFGIAQALTNGLTVFEDSLIWQRFAASHLAGDLHFLIGPLALFAIVVTLAIIAAVAWAFVPLGQWLGRMLDDHPRPIVAYTANLAGSIAGIALFDIATIAWLPPSLWLLPVAAAFALLALWAEDGRPARVAAAALAISLAFWGRADGTSDTTWSPYQKLTREPLAEKCGEVIRVNNVGYQAMLNVDPVYMREHPVMYPPAQAELSHYTLPRLLVGPRDRVLVVGSGSGNDVAGALVGGARSVHAVEIDPVIIDWGSKHHPNHPYADPRVQLTVDDARAFFRRDHSQYDLIWFGLLDSHTTPSAYTNVRLDHFVYTRESFADMKRLLAPGGVVVMFFDAQAGWITDRLVGLLTETFGTRPIALDLRAVGAPCLGWGGMMLIAGAEGTLPPIAARAATNPKVAPHVIKTESFPLATEMTTDDWPYLYLRAPQVPKYHLFVGVLALLMGVGLRRRLFRKDESVEMPMLLLGMGFMLLEVVGVSRAALLFGTTWTVNAYVVGAILACALGANWIAARFPPRRFEIPFVGLLATLVMLAVLPVSWLAALPTAARIVVGGAFLAVPVLFSGLLFVSLWVQSKRRDLAFGSNLLGSLLGGVASMATMLVGFRALIFVTMAVYLLVLLRVRSRRYTSEPASHSDSIPIELTISFVRRRRPDSTRTIDTSTRLNA